MHYKSIQDLNLAIINGLTKIPAGTDLIVGVPRSGMLAANILALHLNLPLTDVEGFIQGRILQSGERLKKYTKPFSDYRRVVVLEDSIRFGDSIKHVKTRLDGLHPDKEIIYSAVFIGPEVADKVDFHFDVCPTPRVFEWNLMHHVFLNKTCMTIDGILRRRPSTDELGKPIRLRNFLRDAELLVRPTQSIGFLIADQSEEFRDITEAWLIRNNIEHDQLIMSPVAAGAAESAKHKATVYKNDDCKLFIDSSYPQSIQIAELSGKPVFCTETRSMVHPGLASTALHFSRKTSQRIGNKLKRLADWRVRHPA